MIIPFKRIYYSNQGTQILLRRQSEDRRLSLLIDFNVLSFFLCNVFDDDVVVVAVAAAAFHFNENYTTVCRIQQI